MTPESKFALPLKALKNTWDFLSHRDTQLVRFYNLNVKNNNPISNSEIGSKNDQISDDFLPPEPVNNPNQDNKVT